MISHVLRLQPQDDLTLKIKEYLQQKNISAAYIATAIGSLSKVKIRFAGQSNYVDQTGLFEILTLNGTLSRAGCHLHAAISDSQGQVSGGHIGEGCIIRTTAELILIELPDWNFTRVQDAQTGYLELAAEQKEK